VVVSAKAEEADRTANSVGLRHKAALLAAAGNMPARLFVNCTTAHAAFCTVCGDSSVSLCHYSDALPQQAVKAPELFHLEPGAVVAASAA
jgi:L-asparaginase II